MVNDMVKDKKNILIVSMIVVVLALLIVTLLVIFKKDDLNFTPSGRGELASSLQAGSQFEIDNLIKSDLEKNNYSLKDAKIYINPYNHSPLSALMIFKTAKPTAVTVTIEGKHGDDLEFHYEKATDHYVPIYALYQNHENKIKVSLDTGESVVHTIPTGQLDIGLEVNASLNDLPSDDNGLYFLTSSLNMRSLAIDKYGEIRWYADGMYYHNIVENNGHIMIGTGEMNEDGLSTELLEIDYLGRVYKSYEIDSGYLNDFFIKKDGNIIVASKNEKRKTFSDYIIEIDGKTGKVIKSWDVFEQFEKIDEVFANEIARDDYFYNSGIEYYEESDSLLLTYWGGEFVVNLSYKDGSIKWLFSDPKNFTKAFENVLLKGNEGFTYPKSMHSAKLDGDILRVFDNGYSTIKNDSSASASLGAYSSANTYKISGKSITLEKSIDEDKKFFSYALGDYKKVSNIDLILFGREMKDLDYNSNISLNDYDSVASRLIAKDGDRTVLDIELGWSTYSVTKIYLGKENIFSFSDIDYFTTLDPTPKEEIDADIMKRLGEVDAEVPYEFGYTKNIIEHNVLFMSSDDVKLILINDNNEGAMYTLKVKDELDSRKIVTDLAAGKYYVYVLENDVIYKTDSFLEIK